MAIEFLHRGKRWRADTAEEAIELRRKLEKEDYDAAKTNPQFHAKLLREQGNWTPDRVWDLLQGIGKSQKDLLAIVVKQQNISSTALAKRLGLASQIALAGVLSGLSKQLRAMGLSSITLLRIETVWTGKTKTRFFSVMPEFKIAARDAGWPDAWESKKVEVEAK